MERWMRFLWCGLAMAGISTDWLFIQVIYSWGVQWADYIYPNAQSVTTQALASQMFGNLQYAGTAGAVGAASGSIPYVGKGISAASFFAAYLYAAAAIAAGLAILAVWVAYTFQKIGLIAAWAFAPVYLSLGATTWGRGYAIGLLRSIVALSIWSITMAMVLLTAMYWMRYISELQFMKAMRPIPIIGSLSNTISVITTGALLIVGMPYSHMLGSAWARGAFDVSGEAVSAMTTVIAAGALREVQSAARFGDQMSGMSGGGTFGGQLMTLPAKAGAALGARVGPIVAKINPRDLLPTFRGKP